MAQKTPINLPFSLSVGYDIMRDPCAVHNRPAQIPSIAPALTTKGPVFGWRFTALEMGQHQHQRPQKMVWTYKKEPMYKEYPVLPRSRVNRDPSLLLIDPAKKAAKAKVEYTAEFELAVLVESS
jgi:hypothetical protein